ncbi:MAG: hypothetical protein AAF570_28130, partial [Bacteroidota bacterium]
MELQFPHPRRIFASDSDFDRLADEIWHYQYQRNPHMRRFCELLGTTERQFIPIRFFKQYAMKTGDWEAECIFG